MCLYISIPAYNICLWEHCKIPLLESGAITKDTNNLYPYWTKNYAVGAIQITIFLQISDTKQIFESTVILISIPARPS